jgi:methionine-S-sulfoxide reductase
VVSVQHRDSSVESLPRETARSTEERAILAGGCFWGMQGLIRRYSGVISTRVSYSGGEVPNATYRNHGSHAEAIEVVFDPQNLSYRELLEYFFQIHDPTTLNRQEYQSYSKTKERSNSCHLLKNERSWPAGASGVCRT